MAALLLSQFKNLQKGKILNISKLPHGNAIIVDNVDTTRFKIVTMKGRNIAFNNRLSPIIFVNHIIEDTDIFPDGYDLMDYYSNKIFPGTGY